MSWAYASRSPASVRATSAASLSLIFGRLSHRPGCDREAGGAPAGPAVTARPAAGSLRLEIRHHPLDFPETIMRNTGMALGLGALLALWACDSTEIGPQAPPT